MTFTWPFALLLVVAVPAVVGVYVHRLRRRRKEAVTYSSLSLLRSVVPRRSRWQRHVPVAAVAASLFVLAIGSARPTMHRSVPISRTSIILAIDVSRSMCATDVDPNRLTAAQQATRTFVEHQASGTRTGLVVFSGAAQLAVAPTRDRKALLDAIDGLSTGFGTAIGAAMLKSIDAIAAVNPNVQPVGDVSITGGDTTSTTVAPPPAHAGGYVPDIVVLLTDGANNRGIAPLDAVPYAVERRVRIYTIGFGTPQIAQLACTPQQLGGDVGGFGDGRFGGGGFGGGGFGGGGFGGFGGRSPLRADLPTLQQVSAQTGGKSYRAEDAQELRKVFASLPKDVTVQKQRREVSAWFVGLGLVLLLGAVAASLKWSPYP